MVDDILNFLEDGRWHDFLEVVKNFGLPQDDANIIISFLGKFGFIELNQDEKKIKMKTTLLNFLQAVK